MSDRVSARYVATDVSPDEAPDGPRREWPSMEAWLADPDHYWYPEPEMCTAGEDILKRLRDALETAARWFVRREGVPPERAAGCGRQRDVTGFRIKAAHYERRRGWRGWIDLLLCRKPIRVIDRVEIL